MCCCTYKLSNHLLFTQYIVLYTLRVYRSYRCEMKIIYARMKFHLTIYFSSQQFNKDLSSCTNQVSLIKIIHTDQNMIQVWNQYYLYAFIGAHSIVESNMRIRFIRFSIQRSVRVLAFVWWHLSSAFVFNCDVDGDSKAMGRH